MNLLHRWYCRSSIWSRTVRRRLLPWVLADVELGDAVLELGPGPGLTTRELVRCGTALTVVELDPVLAQRLERDLGDQVTVVTADATALPQPDHTFSAVVCFTMLHHLPSARAQDELFAQAYRVLRPGGVFAGSDSRTSLRFRLYHLADTLTPVAPDDLPNRLAAAGFADIRVDSTREHYRFRATRPA